MFNPCRAAREVIAARHQLSNPLSTKERCGRLLGGARADGFLLGLLWSRFSSIAGESVVGDGERRPKPSRHRWRWQVLATIWHGLLWPKVRGFGIESTSRCAEASEIISSAFTGG
jgi:hypothetical protein